MKKEDYQRGRRLIKEDIARVVARYLEEVVRYKEELARADLSKIRKSRKEIEYQGIRNAKLLALLEIQEITNHMIRELNVLKISKSR